MVQRTFIEQQMGKDGDGQVRQEKQAVDFHFPLCFKKAVHFGVLRRRELEER